MGQIITANTEISPSSPSQTSNVAGLVNQGTLSNLNNSNPSTFGDQLRTQGSQKIVQAGNNSKLEELLKEKETLIQEEINLDLEYTKQKAFEKKYTLEKLGNYYVTTPKEIIDNNIALIFGGCCWANLDWFLKQIPESLLNKKRLVLVDESDGKGTTTYSQGLSFTLKKFPNTKISSISGYSKGGYQAWQAINNISDYSFINLIDPSMYDNEASNLAPKVANSPKVLMVYWPDTWKGGYPKTYAAMKKAGPVMGSSAISLSIGHGDMPKYFFSTYENRF
jgi:hypothetical protein